MYILMVRDKKNVTKIAKTILLNQNTLVLNLKSYKFYFKNKATANLNNIT